MRIPIHHLKGLPAPNFLNEFDIQAGHVHLRCCRMPEIVETEILDAGFFESNVKSLVEFRQLLSVIISKNKSVVKSFLRFFSPIAQSFEKPIRNGISRG